jgi:hypothetical protein
MTKQTGIPIYAPKPYLLVAMTGATGKPVEISVVYLNDPSKVIYADPRSGFGSSNLTMALANGQLTTFGQIVDSKGVETLTATLGGVGGLATSLATAVKDRADAAATRAKTGVNQDAVSVAKAGKDVLAVAAEMDIALKKKGLAGFGTTDLDTIGKVQVVLQVTGTSLADPTQVQSATANRNLVDAQADKLASLTKALPGTASARRSASIDIVTKWVVTLRGIVAGITDQPPTTVVDSKAPATFELYEIVQDASGKPALLRRMDPK